MVCLAVCGPSGSPRGQAFGPNAVTFHSCGLRRGSVLSSEPACSGSRRAPLAGRSGTRSTSTSQHDRESPPAESRAVPVGDVSLCPQLVEIRVSSQPPPGVCVAAGVLHKSRFPAAISPGLKAVQGGARRCSPSSRQDRGLPCYLHPTPGSQRFLGHCPLPEY